MLIITGMGRSGTSVLSRFCHNMGYMVGGKWCEQVNAGMEEPIVVSLNNRIMAGTSRKSDKQEIFRLNRLVIKDPRFTFPQVLATWLSVRSDLKFLMLLRETKHAIASRQANPDWFTDPENEESLNSRIVESYRTLARFRTAVETLEFPDFLERYDHVHSLLTDFGGLVIDEQRGRTCWDALVSRKKVHHQ